MELEKLQNSTFASLSSEARADAGTIAPHRLKIVVRAKGSDVELSFGGVV